MPMLGVPMEFVRKIVDSSALDQVLTLPRSLLNREVEILVFPVKEKGKNKRADGRLDYPVADRGCPAFRHHSRGNSFNETVEI